MTSPAVVVLAAGASRRLGECKALVDLGGRPALMRLLSAARGLGDPRPLVVTGPDHVAITDALEGHCVDLVHNPDWQAGRTGGLSLAVGARPGRDLCVAPVDHPLVLRSTFEALLARWVELGEPAPGWLAPRHQGRHGHPVLLGRQVALESTQVDPDAPLRVLRARATPLADTPVVDPGVLLDLDTPEDLARLRAVATDQASGKAL